MFTCLIRPLVVMLVWGITMCSLAAEHQYPVRPVRMITGNPGATADVLARQIGRHLSERWGRQLVVENRGGAAATIAAELVAKATPDGYTLLMGQLNSHALAVNLDTRLAYDPIADFAPITRVASAPQVLVAGSALPVRGWGEFARFVRQRPGAINFASAGHGTVSHLTAELLKQSGRIELVHVNYKGGAAAMVAIASGEVQAGFVPLATALPPAQAGKVKLLAIASLRRFPTQPEIQTLQEAGVPRFEAASWFGVFAPARTPAALVARLNDDIVAILSTPVVRDDLLKHGAEAGATTPGEFSEFLVREIAKWRDVIKAAGIATR
jgi:tripartite-type tricarboxylate transporter receptor subunit TctC